MLSFFRKWLTSWPVLALLGLVLVAFVVTGVGDPFGGGGPDTSVARVGNAKITETRLLAQFDRIVRRARQDNPQLTAQQVAREGGVVQVLDQLIATTSLEEFATKVGIGVSERMIDGEIASVPAFKVAGKFDQDTFRRILAQQRLSERELREGLRGDLIRRQMLAPVTAGTVQPLGLVAPYAELLIESRQGEIGLVPPTAVPEPAAPTAAQLQSYYDRTKSRYLRPEQRAFRYAAIDAEAIAAAVALSDAEIADYFSKNKAKLGGIETRQLAQVVVPDEAQARRLAAEVRGGKSFAAVAAEAGFTATDIALGTLDEAKFAGATNAAVARAAFALPGPGLAGPVKSDFGWHLVFVEAVVPAKVRSADEARGEVIAALRRDKAEQALSDTVGNIEDAFTDKQGFLDVAKANKLTVVDVPLATATGDLAGGGLVAEGAAALLPRAFDSDPADGPHVVEAAPGQFAIIEVTKLVPATPAPMATVRPQLIAGWLAEARSAAVKKLAEAIVADVNKGQTLAAALSARKLPAPQQVSGRRLDAMQNPQITPPEQLFLSLPKGGIRAAPAGPMGGYIVVQVTAVTPGDLAAFPGLTSAMADQFKTIAPEEQATDFARAVEREVGVKRNPQALAAVARRVIGEGDAAAK